MTHQLEVHAAAMRLRNSTYLYRRAASDPRNARENVNRFNRQVMNDRALLLGKTNKRYSLPRRLPKHAQPVAVQIDLVLEGRIAC